LQRLLVPLGPRCVVAAFVVLCVILVIDLSANELPISQAKARKRARGLIVYSICLISITPADTSTCVVYYKVTDDFYHLREPKLAVLEAALQRHGAKVVQLRRITEAVKSLSYALSQANNNNNNNTSESGQGAGNGSSNSSSSSPDGDEQADSKRTKLQHSPVGSPPSLPPSPITDPPQASEASPKESPTQNSSSSATTSKRSPLAAATAAAVSKFTSELMARPWSRSRKPPPAPRARAVQSSNRPTPANDTAPETMDSSSEKLTVAESVTA